MTTLSCSSSISNSSGFARRGGWREVRGLLFTAVALTGLFFGAPVQAKHAKGGGQKHAQVAHRAPQGHAKVMHRAAPRGRAVVRAKPQFHKGGKGKAVAFGGRARGRGVMMKNPQFAHGGRPGAGVKGKGFVQRPVRTGSGAVGGNQSIARNRTQILQKNRVRNSVAFGGQTFHQQRNFKYTYAPVEVTRGWDRGHEHAWNHHHWGWRNNAWVIIDPGYYGTPYYGAYPSTYVGAGPVGSEVVADVQAALDQLGYNAGASDGAFGPQTRAALMQYQGDQGLAVTGTINRAVLDSLGI